MADFKTHLTSAVLSAAGFSGVGLLTNAVTVPQAGAIFTVGAFAGLLPDLDSDTGKPLSLLFQLLSVIVPCALLYKASQVGSVSLKFLICCFILAYLILNYVVCPFIKKMTVHRGIMHSIPFSVLCGGVGYLLFENSGSQVAFLGGFAILFGCFVHLILDEINSITIKHGFIPVLKKSSGTSLKFKSSSMLTSLFVYTLLILVSIIAIF
jgi:membrane-bound metal-dependent hydrolase YbcI (DUF457 family)